MRDFKEIWSITQTIEGWFWEPEAIAFYDIISRFKRGSKLVELGSYYGRSSSILGALAKDLDLNFVTVDNFSMGIDTEKTFYENMKKVNAKFRVIKGKSTEVVNQIDNNIDFLFIDTTHIYEQCKIECDLYIPKVRTGGIIAFHDYGGKYTGIKKAVDERKELINKMLAYSLLIANKQ